MPTKRIIANFMYEEELELARTVLTQSEETESYIVGNASSSQIDFLRERGLIVEEIATTSPESAPGFGQGTASTRGDIFTPSDDVEPREIDFYRVYLTGPLLENHRQHLQGLGVSPLEFLPPNTFTAKLSLDQVRQIRTLAFVSDVALFATQKARSDTQTRDIGGGPMLLGDIKTYDIRLHPGEDFSVVTDFLRDRNALVVLASGQKLRIQLLEGEGLLDELAQIPEIAEIEEFVPPKLFNDVARQLLHIDSPPTPPTLPTTHLTQTGKGQIVGVADTGVDDSHPDLTARLVGTVALGRPGNHDDPHGHGTHVAGSIAGDGSASTGDIKGTAPEASIFFQSLLDSRGGLGGLPLNLNDLFEEAYQNGARIHNNSWGADTEARYTFNANEVDEFVDKHKDMLIVFAAGNAGNASKPSNRVSVGSVDWLSVGSPATAKNALTVGASRSSRTSGGFSALTYGTAWGGTFPSPPTFSDRVSGDASSMAEFSSRGPCDDERIKPDLVAPGTDIVSTKSSLAPLRNFWGPHTNSRYAYMGGTSMATPLVTGCAALVRQYYVDDRNHPEPSAALLRATLVNGTQKLAGRSAVAEHPVIPNFHQGFGGVNMQMTIPNKAEKFDLEFVDSWKVPNLRITRTGQRFQFTFELPSDNWLRLCLVYSDAPGRSLQNDLNLTLDHRLPNGKSVKTIGNEEAVASQLLKTPDRKNNVEVIRIENAEKGKYTIQVSAHNFFKGNFQDFALVVSSPILKNFGRTL